MDDEFILKCRVCLGECDEGKMFDLFKPCAFDSEGPTGDENLNLSEKIQYCCGVRLRESPNLPSNICQKCFSFMRMWFSFRQMCANSQVYLETLAKDNKNSSDVGFVEDLLEDLQTFRTNESRANVALDFDLQEESLRDSEEEFLEESAYVEAFPLDEVESDDELDAILMKIKREKDEEEQNEADETKTRRSTRQKKSSAKVERKNTYRPPSVTSYMCSICGNVYNKKASFKYHMNLHSDVKPHECELCGKAFRQVCELKNHMRRHTGEKPYKCNFCDRHFIDRSEKHRHERTHTNTRPYKCHICNKSFMYSAILKNHSKMHSGEKDYNCLVCDKSFLLPHQLKAHLQTITHKQKELQFQSDGYDVIYEKD